MAQYPDRLRVYCGVSPLKGYAVREIERCAEDPHLRAGLKLHFGNSDVQLGNPEHLRRVQGVFRAANRHRMPVVVHLRPSVNQKRAYGAAYATVFLEKVISQAPDVTVQIAHLAGAGTYDDPQVDEALMVFIRAIEKKDRRMARVQFDVSGVAGLGKWPAPAALVAQRIRQLGVERVRYGTDGAAQTGVAQPLNLYKAFRTIPLTEEEFRRIESNGAPVWR